MLLRIAFRNIFRHKRRSASHVRAYSGPPGLRSYTRTRSGFWPAV